jgi:cytochrome c oxidase cbb3-type subunit 3
LPRSEQPISSNGIRRAVASFAARRWRLAALALLAAGAIATWLAHDLRLENRLLRSDPDAVPQDRALVEFGAARGHGVYRSHCASCHGAGGKGDPITGVPNLTDRDWLYGSGQVSDIEKVATYGIRAHNPRSWNLAVMPAFSRPVPSATERIPPLRPEEIADVTQYLLSLAGRPADSQAAQRGGYIYGHNGGCYDCHTADAKGDPAIGAPNLTDRIWLYGDGSAAAIAYSIAHGRQGMCPAWTGKLSPLRLREVALYVYALSHKRPPQKAG